MGRSTPQDIKELFNNILMAVKNCDFNQFNAILKNEKDQDRCENIQALFETQGEGNNIFHNLLANDNSRWGRHKRRKIRAKMFHQLLSEEGVIQALDAKDNEGNTPLHLAIKKGYENLVDRMLEVGANIAIVNNLDQSSLELAAIHQKYDLYKKLLKCHNKLNTASTEAGGYSCEQIIKAQNIQQANLKRKQKLRGILGAFLTIACPVGTVLAFNELPLLEIFFTAALPSFGAIGVIVGSVVGGLLGLLVGGLLFWSIYEKSSKKYGAHAQELLELSGKVSQIKRLEAERQQLDSQPLERKNISVQKIKFQRDRAEIFKNLDDIYKTLGKVEPRHEAKPSDWTTAGDRFRAKMLTAGSFLCSFSGIFGILGVVSSYLPLGLLAGTVFAGIPVVGWIALGVALAVGIGIAAWAYHAKFKPILVECGKTRQTLHEKKVAIWEQKEEFDEQKSLQTSKVEEIFDSKISNLMTVSASNERNSSKKKRMLLAADQGPDNSKIWTENKFANRLLPASNEYQTLVAKKRTSDNSLLLGDSVNPNDGNPTVKL